MTFCVCVHICVCACVCMYGKVCANTLLIRHENSLKYVGDIKKYHNKHRYATSRHCTTETTNLCFGTKVFISTMYMYLIEGSHTGRCQLFISSP